MTYVVVAALAAGVGAGTVLAINSGKSTNPIAGQPFRQRGTGDSGTGSQGGSTGPGLSDATRQAIENKVVPGVVDITSNLKYTGGTAEATGIVISPSGLVLTNNHVINGSTELTARSSASGRRYKATVVGYDKADDIAVIKLTGAAGLKTVSIGDSSKVKVGNPSLRLATKTARAGRLPSSARSPH